MALRLDFDNIFTERTRKKSPIHEFQQEQIIFSTQEV